jgi:hypothetical protein
MESNGAGATIKIYYDEDESETPVGVLRLSAVDEDARDYVLGQMIAFLAEGAERVFVTRSHTNEVMYESDGMDHHVAPMMDEEVH